MDADDELWSALDRVAVMSDRPRDEVAELMFLSGSKGGARVVAPDGLAALTRVRRQNSSWSRASRSSSVRLRSNPPA